MTLDLATQQANAVENHEFRSRVEASSMDAAIASFSAAPITGTAQAQRVGLANAILKDSGFAVDAFAWVVVSRPNFNDVSELQNDAWINTAVTAAFDKVAQQLIAPVAGGP